MEYIEKADDRQINDITSDSDRSYHKKSCKVIAYNCDGVGTNQKHPKELLNCTIVK